MEEFNFKKLRVDVMDGDLMAVEHWVARGGSLVDPERETRNPKSLLDLAISLGDVHMVECLVRLGAPMEDQNDSGYTPLMNTVADRYLEIDKKLQIMDLLLKAGASTNTDHLDHFAEMKNHLGWSLLHIAAETGAASGKDGALQVVQRLLQEGLDLQVLDRSERRSLLHVAATSADFKLVQFLVQNGLDPRQKNHPIQWDANFDLVMPPQTALEMAKKYAGEEVKMIISYLSEAEHAITEKEELQKVSDLSAQKNNAVTSSSKDETEEPVRLKGSL